MMFGGDDDEDKGVLNGLFYCDAHGREICQDCPSDFTYYNERQRAFQLPENGIPQYPSGLRSISGDQQLMSYLGKRWLDMQRELYPGKSPRLTAALVRLPRRDVPGEVETSAVAVQGTLLQLFRQLQVMASTQHYYFGHQSRIMLQDHDTFNKAAVLYQEKLYTQYSRIVPLFGDKPDAELRRVQFLKTRASIVNTFGFFLQLNTQRTFWRAMELTADAFVLHIERFDEESDGQVVLTDKAKGVFIVWLAHSFWALQLAQFQLDELRAIQLEIYQYDVFPFFPYTWKALEEDSDIHLIIAKLSKAPVHDLPLFSSLFSKLRQASAIPEQMQKINADLMGAIDELSTRFRFLETLILAARLVAAEDEIKSAIGGTFKFNRRGREVNSLTDDVMFILSCGVQESDRVNAPKTLSFLQELTVKENLFRQRNVHRVMRPPFAIDNSNRFPKDMFNTFSANFKALYDGSIRRQWKEDEYSLLSLDVARRFQHRRDIKKKKERGPLSGNYEKAGTGAVRSVPEKVHVDPSLFWEIGDGSLEKYVPPVIRSKIKTRKQDVGNETEEDSVIGSESVSASVIVNASDAPGLEAAPRLVQRPLDQLKRTDLVTRDILWRKIKGSLKWTQLAQFLSRLGCKILNLDGSKKKIVDTLSGRCTVLHRPHPGDECRPDQRESYRVHIEDWLKIKYSHIVPPNDLGDSEILEGDFCCSATTTTEA